MTQKELISLLTKIIFLILFIFFIFIITINIYKFVEYVVKIDQILKLMEEDNKELPLINTQFNYLDINEGLYDPNIAYTAEKLGYRDRLKDINGSEWGEGINILVIGSDKKDFHKEKSRADVIIVLRIIKSGKILSLSIPRDSLITFSTGEYKGYTEKIGHSLFWGGLENLKHNIEIIMGSPIHKVIIVDNFRSFEAFLSIIGGIKVDKFLYGKLGIQWIRNRNFVYGDIERCKRQQIFIKKAISKLWEISKKGNYFYCIFAYRAFKRIFETDLTEEEFIKIIYILKSNNFLPEENLYSSVLNGSFGKYNSILSARNNLSCWILDEKEIEKIRLLFYSDSKNFSFYDRKITFFDYLKNDIQIILANKNTSNNKIKQSSIINK